MATESEIRYVSKLDQLKSHTEKGEVEIASSEEAIFKLYDGVQSFELVYQDGELIQRSRFGPEKSFGEYGTPEEAAEALEDALGIDLSIEEELSPNT
ncbi:MAG: hypothetical protein ACLFRK_02640 [Candidatus Nanohaloarchaea archaeon]